MHYYSRTTLARTLAWKERPCHPWTFRPQIIVDLMKLMDAMHGPWAANFNRILPRCPTRLLIWKKKPNKKRFYMYHPEYDSYQSDKSILLRAVFAGSGSSEFEMRGKRSNELRADGTNLCCRFNQMRGPRGKESFVTWYSINMCILGYPHRLQNGRILNLPVKSGNFRQFLFFL